MDETGRRVRDAIRSSGTQLNQSEIALEIGMGRDALSRALNGQRRFSAMELARISGVLGVSIRWLITGGSGQDEDGQDKYGTPGNLDRIAETVAFPAAAYREVGLETGCVAVMSPGRDAEDAASEVSVRLSKGLDVPFISDLPEAIERAFGLGVFVSAEGPNFDARAMQSGRISYILVRGTGAWFQANLVLARELGQLLSGTLAGAGARSPGGDTWSDDFASALLLPAGLLRSIDWNRQTPGELASFLWESGASANALMKRLDRLRIPRGPAWVHADEGTLQLLAHQMPDCLSHPRARAYRSPRIPPALLKAHLKALRDGLVDGSSLAWMLDTPMDEL